MAKVPVFRPRIRESLIERQPLPAVTIADHTKSGDFGSAVTKGLDKLAAVAMDAFDDAYRQQQARRAKQKSAAVLEQQQRDELTATRVGNAFQVDLHYLVRGENGFLNRHGVAAVDTGIDTVAAMQDSFSKSLKSMPASHRARFVAENTPLMELRMAEVRQHSLAQQVRVQDQQLAKSLQDQQVQLVVGSTRGGRLDQAELDMQLQAMKPVFDDLARTRGWAPDEVDRRWRVLQSGQFRGVAERLVDLGDLAGARALMEARLQDISPDDAAWLDRIVTVAEGIVHTDRLVETIWGGGEDDMMENAYE